MSNVTHRRKFIAQLEVPSHNDFSDFSFIDTLVCMSRGIVESAYIREEVAESKKMSLQHMQLNKQVGADKINNAIQGVLNKQDRNHKNEFRNYINGIANLNKDIASVSDLIKTAGKMGKRALGKIDINKLEESQNEIYSSKHYIYGELIVNCWRDFLEVKADEIEMVQMTKKPAAA